MSTKQKTSLFHQIFLLIITSGCADRRGVLFDVKNNGKVVRDPFADPTVVQLNTVPEGICSGTVVVSSGRKVVVTAAHCVLKHHYNFLESALKSVKVDLGTEEAEPTQILVHPKYQGTAQNDIALLFFDSRVNLTKSRKIGVQPKVNDVVTVDGFGAFLLSERQNDDDRDGFLNGDDYCPETVAENAIMIDDKGCSFDENPVDFGGKKRAEAYQAGIRRTGKNTIASVGSGVLRLKFTYRNRFVQVNETQIAKGDSGGPLFDQRGDLIGVASMALWDSSKKSQDAVRSSEYTDTTLPCNKEFIHSGRAIACKK